MEKTNKVDSGAEDLFEKHKDEITPAYQRAVREAILKHKRNGHPIATVRDGKVVVLQPDEIEID